jgi:hypothetical protein
MVATEAVRTEGRIETGNVEPVVQRASSLAPASWRRPKPLEHH